MLDSTRQNYEKELALHIFDGWLDIVSVSPEEEPPYTSHSRTEEIDALLPPLETIGQNLWNFQTKYALYHLNLDLEGLSPTIKLIRDFLNNSYYPVDMAAFTAQAVSKTSLRWSQERTPNKIWTMPRSINISTTFITTLLSRHSQDIENFIKKRIPSLNVDLIWKTTRRYSKSKKKYNEPCSICLPLHNKGRKVWEKRYPAGAPAHIGCNCSLELSIG